MNEQFPNLQALTRKGVDAIRDELLRKEATGEMFWQRFLGPEAMNVCRRECWWRAFCDHFERATRSSRRALALVLYDWRAWEDDDDDD